jgi:ABC-type branched-subunit amino acid transport system ATPase component/branched-subunit amino acid ABC-type transport system permease component
MHLNLQLLILGIAGGGAYALSAMGLVVTFKGSGVLNFAQGAIGMVGAFVYAIMQRHGTPVGYCLIIGCLVSGIVGALVYLLFIRPLRGYGQLAKIIATLAALLTIEYAALLIFGSNRQSVPSPVSINYLRFLGYDVPINGLVITGVAVGLAIALSLYYRKTVAGLATEALSLNEPATVRLGYLTERLAIGNWALGGLIAGAAAIFLVNTVGLDQIMLSSLVITVMPAAIVGGFRSLWLTLAAGEFIGVISSLLVDHFTRAGVIDVVPFVLVVLALLWRSDAIPTRSTVDLFRRLPAAPLPTFQPVKIAIGAVVVIVVGFLLSSFWLLQFAEGFGVAIIGLSIVLVTGYLGQISIAQWSIAGVGALYGGSLAEQHGYGILLVLLISAAIGFVIGVGMGLVTRRIQGVTLLVVTLVGGNVLVYLWFVPIWDLNPVLVNTPEIFGWNLGNRAFYFFSVIVMTLFAIGLWVLRRMNVGRRLLAMRASERAAEAGGLNVRVTTLVVFGASAAMAACGGVLFIYGAKTSLADPFLPLPTAVLFLLLVYLNGIGTIAAGISAFSAVVVPALLSEYGVSQDWFSLFIGVAVMGNLLLFPDGAFATRAAARQRERDRRFFTDAVAVPHAAESTGGSRSVEGVIRRSVSPVSGTREHDRVGTDTGERALPEYVLAATGVTVTFGGNRAVDDVSVVVGPGEIVGLIGPNGAGKTTFFDALTGFVRVDSGRVELLGRRLSRRLAPFRRARRGMRRTFQGSELFDDMTVRENLDAVAVVDADTVERTLVGLGLDKYADVVCMNVPTGLRRKVDFGRTLVGAPAIVLLDEPGAGLGLGDKYELAETLRTLARDSGFSFLLVDHDIELVKAACSRIYVLNLGKLVADGSPEEVTQSAIVLEAYLGMEA